MNLQSINNNFDIGHKISLIQLLLPKRPMDFFASEVIY